MNDCCGSSESSVSLALIVKTMADNLLDTTPLISGAAILLAFFAGYKYARSTQTVLENPAGKNERGNVASGSSSGSGESAPIVSFVLSSEFVLIIYGIKI